VSANLNTQGSLQFNHKIASLAVELQVLDRPLADKVLAFVNSQAAPVSFVEYLAQSGRFAPDSLEMLQQEWARRNAPPSPVVPPMRRPDSGMLQAPPPSGSNHGASDSNYLSHSSSVGPAIGVSAMKADELLAFLLGKTWQFIPLPQLIECRNLQPSTGRRLGFLLMERGYINREHLEHAASMVYRTFAICAVCAQTHNLQVGNRAACPRCQGPWFQDNVDAMLAGPAPAVPTTPVAPIHGMMAAPPSAPTTTPPGHPGAMEGHNPRAAAPQMPTPIMQPAQPAQDPNDPFSAPVGYQEKNKIANFSELLATSSVNRKRRKFVPPEPMEDSDPIGMGLSTDELTIFSGPSGDDFAPPDLSPIPKGKKVESLNPATESPTNAPTITPPTPSLAGRKTGKHRKNGKNAKTAQKKGCFGKSAALLIMGASILVPLVAYAW
jgi:hypothetical protein